MATQLELQELFTGGTASDLRKRIITCIAIKAQTVATSSPTPADRAWALTALQKPEQYEDFVFRSLLAQNAGLTTSQILGVTEELLLTAVSNAIDALILEPASE